MKQTFLIILLIAISYSVSAQKLIDKYKKGTVELVPDENFAQNNDWDKIFRSYYDSLMGRPIGKRKSIIVLDDGTVVINNAYKDYYIKFSPTGKFITDFGITINGKKEKSLKPIYGYIQNTFYNNADNMGNVKCFDFNGNFKKYLKLNYATKQVITLNDNELAVAGWSIWTDKFRDFVSIVDYNTNKEKIIWDSFTKRTAVGKKDKMFNYSYKFKERGAFSITTMPYSKSTGMSIAPIINKVNNKLVISVPTTGEILVYDFTGKLIEKTKINWAKNYISIAEQKEIQQKAINKYKEIKNPHFASWVSEAENKKALNTIIKEMEADFINITEPYEIPVFSTVIKDSDDNLLFFEFAKKNYENKFNVWILNNNGEFIAKSSFVCKDYKLEIKPSKMVFHNGYIYAIIEKKNEKGNPLRLVRFILQ